MKLTPRFNLIELLIAVTTAVVATFWVTARPAPSGPTLVGDDTLLSSVAEKYGPKVSQGPEEWLIRDFFQDRREGVFVDVGSYEPVKWSNTYRLEHDLGWTGLGIDALADFAPAYQKERPHTRFVVGFVADRDAGSTTIHVNPDELAVSSGVEGFTRLFGSKVEAREVPIRTLDRILEEAGIGHIDLLSMDIELGEPVALQHFSIDRHRPELVVVEAHADTRQALLDYFAAADYVVVGRYLRADPVNLYFRPRFRPEARATR